MVLYRKQMRGGRARHLKLSLAKMHARILALSAAAICVATTEAFSPGALPHSFLRATGSALQLRMAGQKVASVSALPAGERVVTDDGNGNTAHTDCSVLPLPVPRHMAIASMRVLVVWTDRVPWLCLAR